MEIQIVLYIYSFPSYLREQPRVKIGRTSGSIETDPTELAWQRIRSQIKTSHPEEAKLLGAVRVPGEWVETTIHSQLKNKGYHISEAPGIEWFKFPNQKELQNFLDMLYRSIIIDDFSEFGGGRTDIKGDSFDSIISAFGVKKLNGKDFRNEIDLIKILNDELSPLYPGFPQWFDKTMKSSDSVFNVAYRDLEEIGTEEKPRQAVEFDFLMPLCQVVHLNDLLSNGVLNGPPQKMHSLSLEHYRKAVKLGGIYAG
jgi:hypothetical protein